MRAAFVVQLGPETKPLEGRFEGWVEEVRHEHRTQANYTHAVRTRNKEETNGCSRKKTNYTSDAGFGNGSAMACRQRVGDSNANYGSQRSATVIAIRSGHCPGAPRFPRAAREML